MDSSAVSGSSLSQMVRPIRVYSQQMDAFSLSGLCFSISLITPITRQLVGYLMLSPSTPRTPGLRFGWGLDSFFQGHFINNPVCPVPVGWADVAAEFTTSEALWPCSLLQCIIQIHSLSHTHTHAARRAIIWISVGVQLECRRSSSAAKTVKLPHSRRIKVVGDETR